LPEVAIRKATPQDGATIIKLINALADYEKLPPPDPKAQERLLQDAFAENPRFEVFLAEVDGEVAGYTFSFETYSTFLALPTFYLEDIFVLAEHRSKKVGYALFMNCVKEAHARGCGRLEWTVLDWNQLAIDFYHKLGATHMKEWLPHRLVHADFVKLLEARG
jgi:GNAT superfamily N-acetyltransferase